MSQNPFIAGTLATKFQIGTSGATIYTGTATPGNGTGADGDVYLQSAGTASNMYIHASGTWLPTAAGNNAYSTAGHYNFFAYNPAAENNFTDITVSLQNFLLWCQLQALMLKSSSLDDQSLRSSVTAYLPRGYYNVSCPIVVPELVNLQVDGIIVRNGAAGTITNNYTGNTSSQALVNLYQPTVIIVPRAHCETVNIYSNTDGTHAGAGMFVGKNWTLSTAAIAVAGTGYVVNDVITLAQPSKSPYIAATCTVTTVNASGGITGMTLTQPGAYALPPVLQAQQWTSANGFAVFDGSGNFLTTGGSGTGATVTPTWLTDWSASGGTTYNMGLVDSLPAQCWDTSRSCRCPTSQTPPMVT